MYPVSLNHPQEVIFAKDQPQYNPLPAIKWKDGTILTKWKLPINERIRLLFSGHIFLTLKTFNQPLQPVKLSIDDPTYTILEETENAL